MNYYRALQMVCMIVVFVQSLAFSAHAGVVIKEKDGETSYLSEGKIKVVTGEKSETLWYIMDSNRDLVTLVDEERKAYASGTPDEYCEVSKSLGEEIKKEILKEMSPEERKIFENYMKEGPKKPGDVERLKAKKPRVVIEKTGDEVIAGLKTARYEVMVEGEKYEDLWIATDVSLGEEMKEIESRMLAIQKRFEKCSGAVEADKDEDYLGSSPEYAKLLSKGFVMKEISYMDDYEEEGEVVSEVISLEKKNVPSSEFKVPPGYKKLSLKEFLRGQLRHEDSDD